jgi:hypothetical protein
MPMSPYEMLLYGVRGIRTESCLSRIVSAPRFTSRLVEVLFHPPTLDVASVRLLSVVLFPAEGLPTRPIKGSRGIMAVCAREQTLRTEKSAGGDGYEDVVGR